MNILFVVQDLGFEQLGIMMLSAMLKKSGHKVSTVRARYSDIKRKLINNNSTVLLAYSSTTLSIRDYLALNRMVKTEIDVFSVFGGSHCTLFPETINEKGVDGVCVGEGDYALVDLANNLNEGSPITNIPNWWIKQDGQIFRNPPRPLIKNLENLPFPDRTLFANYSTISAITTRGCSYGCSYCCARSELRCRSVDSVIEELKEAKDKTRARFVVFWDLTFNVATAWLKEFSEKYKKDIGRSFGCSLRADLVNHERVRYLKEAGCFSIQIGLETANEYLNNHILKKRTSKKQILAAAEIIKRYGIRLVTSSLLGLPYGSLDDDFETFKLNIRLRPSLAKANLLYVYRNTELFDFLRADPKISATLNNWRYGDFGFVLQSAIYNQNIRVIKNLHKLFSIAVHLPFIRPFLPFLIRLPIYPFYWCLNIIWMFSGLHFQELNEGNCLLKCKIIIIDLVKGARKLFTKAMYYRKWSRLSVFLNHSD